MDGDDLEQTTGRAVYADCRIGEIRVERGNELLELRVPGSEHYLRPGETWGDVDASAVAREMIRRTIRAHLDKEKRLRPQGIKVLSLFFIDKVERYRGYDSEGNAVKGDYARIFEKEYRRIAKHPDYDTLFKEVDVATAAEDVHNGYFSIDKKGRWTDTAENNQANRDNAEQAYKLIMRQKEKLLSLDTRSSSSSPTRLCARVGTTPTCSRSARCATSSPSGSGGRPSAAACDSASIRKASACAASRSTR